MNDKTKKIIEKVGWVTTVAGVTALLVAGVSTESISSGIALLDVAVTAVGAAIIFIAGKLKGKK